MVFWQFLQSGCMKFYFNITSAIEDDLHLVTALKGLQPSYRLACNSCPNYTVAMAGRLFFSMTTNSAGGNQCHRRVSKRQSLVVKLVGLSLISTTQCLFTKRFSALAFSPCMACAAHTKLCTLSSKQTLSRFLPDMLRIYLQSIL